MVGVDLLVLSGVEGSLPLPIQASHRNLLTRTHGWLSLAMRMGHLASFTILLFAAFSQASANAQVCGENAEKAPALEQAGDITTAIWCYGLSKQWAAVVGLEMKAVPASLAKVGAGNYATIINTIARAHLELHEWHKGRKILEIGMRQLLHTPQVFDAANNLSVLFRDDTMWFAERQSWHKLLMEAMEQPRPAFQLADIFTNNVYFGVYKGISEKKTRAAFAMAQDAVTKHDADMLKHWGFMRDMVQIQHLALSHDVNPTAAKRRLRMLFIVVPETKLTNSHPTYGNVDTRLAELDLFEITVNFRLFASAFQALTGIGWDMKMMRHPGAVRKSTYVSDPPRSVMHPLMDSIEPAFSPAIQREIANSDGVTLVWAGTKQPPGHLITNGSGTEYGFPINGQTLHRLLVISDSNKRFLDGNHANSALFFFHEIFHVLEWAYHKSPFPSAEHSYSRRNLWPADYVGNTEWDFYRETFTKRFMPEDSMDRFEWGSNHGGFHNQKAKGK